MTESPAPTPIAELPLLASPRTEVFLVETAEELEEAVQTLAAANGPFAVDAERASGFKYSQRAYLVQIYRAGSPIYLIDPAAIAPDADPKPFAGLSELMKSDAWILHAASQDIPCLRELGLTATSLFDTELGSRIAGLDRVGLGAVTESLLGVRLAKEHSAVDWSTRPLANDWLNYAALDVDVLFDLWAAVEAVLIERNKLEWAKQEFAATLLAQPKPAKVDKWRGMTGLHEVKDAKKLAIARELWSAREALAVKLDVSPGRLIPDSSIVNVVKETPKSKPQLAGNRSFVGRASRSYLDTWWKAIEDGLNSRDLPPIKVAATGMPNHRIWPTRFPDADRRLKIIRPLIADLGEKHGIPVENILTPDFLRNICFEPPAFDIAAVASALRALGARDWQIELTGQLIVDGLVASLAAEEAPNDLA
ncbi:MAG: HRDC domain-containing protein [Rhodoluna sp.]|nr:HRDC domain-containing protein [Rhodoluna sp.]